MGEAALSVPDDLPIVPLEHDGEVAALPSIDPERQPVPLLLAAKLLTYGQGRLGASVGADRLQASGLAVPAFLEIYAPGYFPATYRQAISPEDADLLGGIDLADSVAVPAFDLNGTLSDLAIWKLTDGPVFAGSLQPEPTGAFAPRLVAVAAELVLVLDLPDLCRRLAAGERHVQLLRPDIPVEAQIRDLQARGLKAVRVDDPQLAAICTSLGVPITADAPEAGWAFVSFERDHRRVLYRSGAVVASLLIPAPDSTKLRVDLRHADGRNQGDTFDVAVPRQVQAFCTLASRKLQVDVVVLSRLFDAGLLDRLRALEDDDQAQPARPTASEPADVDACAADPAVVDRFVKDADVLGWVGDTQTKALALLTIAGLGLEQPPWLMLRGPSAVTLPIAGILADLVPAERRLHLSRATEASIVSQGPDGLRHRLIVLDEAAAVKAATVTTLRVLQARGGIALPVSARDAATGRMTSRLSEARGPVGVLCAASDPCSLDELAVVVRLDETPQQTARVQAAARQAAQSGIDLAARNRCRARWQAILAGLPRLPVRVPAADRVVFPSRHPRHRVELAQFMALVEASALLHHRQRAQVDGCLIASEVDVELVIQATRGVLGRNDDGLSDRAQVLIGILAARPDRSITIPQLAEIMPQWTRDVVRGVLDELVCASKVTRPSAGRGRKAHPIVLVADVQPEAPSIHLLPPGDAGMQTTPNWGSSESAIPNCDSTRMPIKKVV